MADGARLHRRGAGRRAAALTDGVAASLSSGLHHAGADYGAGFCTVNGLVVTAAAMLAAGRAARVLIVDLDAHCGGGTAAMIAADERIVQVDVAVDSFDAYDERPGARLWHVHRSGDYLPAVAAALAAAERSGPFDLVLYNAGVDPHEHCDIGGLGGIDAAALAERDRLVFDWCGARGVPAAVVLAGGYVGTRLGRDRLVGLHRTTLAAAAR